MHGAEAAREAIIMAAATGGASVGHVRRTASLSCHKRTVAGGRLSMSTMAPVAGIICVRATVQSAICVCTSLAGGNVAGRGDNSSVCCVQSAWAFSCIAAAGRSGNEYSLARAGLLPVWKRWAKLCCNCCCRFYYCWDTCLARGSATGSRATKVDRETDQTSILPVVYSAFSFSEAVN